MRHLTLLFLFPLIAACSTVSNEAPKQPLEIPKVLSTINSDEKYTIEVVREFPMGHGLRGWVVTDNRREIVVYTTQDGEVLIMGDIINANMRRLSREHKSRYIDMVNRSEAFEAANGIHWVGKATDDIERPVIYVFMDPFCNFCKQLWWQLDLMKGRVDIRYTPVSVLGEDSIAAAAQILDADDPLSLLESHYTDDYKPAMRPPTEEGKQQVLRNTAFMRSINAKGAPAILLKDKDGMAYLHEGLISAVELEDLLGIK